MANRLLYVRTVDLFWAFQYHRIGFPRHLDIRGLRESWQERKERRRKAAQALIKKDWLGDEPGILMFPNVAPKRISWARLSVEFIAYLDRFYSDPGRWSEYVRHEKKYFLNELARYEQVLQFWHYSGSSVRQAFLRCARFSNRRSESHPDFLVAFRDSHDRVIDSGFVEVKGPRESLRPSQRRFFPELVRHADQKVLLARFTMDGEDIKFREFTAEGELIPRNTPFDLLGGPTIR